MFRSVYGDIDDVILKFVFTSIVPVCKYGVIISMFSAKDVCVVMCPTWRFTKSFFMSRYRKSPITIIMSSLLPKLFFSESYWS